MSVTSPIIPVPTNPVQSGPRPVGPVNLAEVNRKRLLARAWDYYRGDFKQPLPLPRANSVNDNVILNYCRTLVDKGAAFLFGKEPLFSQEGNNKFDVTPAEKFLEDTWNFNKKMPLLTKIALQGGVTGHVFIKILPWKPLPRIILLDTQNVSVVTAPDDVESVLEYRIEYACPVENLPGYHLQVISRTDTQSQDWTITDYQRKQIDSAWLLLSETTWPYQWCPIMDAQNLSVPNEYYGMADLTADILNLNDSINFSASNISRILKHHANPKTWGRGFRANEVESNIDGFLIIPNDNGEVRNLEMHSDLRSSLEFLQELQDQMHETARMPEITLGKVERLGAITGVALAVLHSPLLERTELKQATYGDLLVRINRALLDLSDVASTNLRTTITWQDMLPKDRLAERQAAVLDKNLGVSQETILGTLGYDPKVEMERAVGETISQAHLQAIRMGITGEVPPGTPKTPNTPQNVKTPNATDKGSGVGASDPARPSNTKGPGTGNGISQKAIMDSVKIAQYETDAQIRGNGR